MQQTDFIDQLLSFGLEKAEVENIVLLLEQAGTPTLVGKLNTATPVETFADNQWRQISKQILNKTHSIQLHQYLHQQIYQKASISPELAPVWTPDVDDLQQSNIYRLMQQRGMTDYQQLYDWSISEPESFWGQMIDLLNICFHRPYRQVLDLKDGVTHPNWMIESQLNIVDSCFQADNQAIAIVYQNPSGQIEKYTYGQLEKLVNRIGNALVGMGVRPDSHVGIDMTMTVEAVAIYLACIKAGAVVVTVADSFAPPEIAVRLQIAEVPLVFTQDLIHRTGKQLLLYQKVVEAGAEKVIVIPTTDPSQIQLREQDLWWSDFLSSNLPTNDQLTAVSRYPNDHCTILFSSGTTGTPKAIPWTQTTPIKSAIDAYLHHDIQMGDCLCWPTSLGWMMGPWLVFSALINRASIALYDDAPTTSEFANFVEKAGVTMLGVVPSLVAQWRSTNSPRTSDWSRIKAFSSTGECSNPDDMFYLMAQANYKPVIEYCGGTEIGGGYITGTVVQPAIPACFSTPALGSAFLMRDEEGQETDNGEVFLLPPALGLSSELLNTDHKAVYYDGIPSDSADRVYRRHGDQIERLANGYFRAHGRVDDAMNLGGIKVSANQIEGVLAQLDFVKESAAIAILPTGGGPSSLVIYLVPDQNNQPEKQEILQIMQQTIRQSLNPLFKISDCCLVEALPRTASNKVMRRKLRQDYLA